MNQMPQYKVSPCTCLGEGHFAKISSVSSADAFFSKETFISGVILLDLHLACRFRSISIRV